MYQLEIEKKREWSKEKLKAALNELMREAKIRQFVYPREHSRWRASRGREGISEDEGRRRWDGLMTAISVIASLLEFDEVCLSNRTYALFLGGDDGV